MPNATQSTPRLFADDACICVNHRKLSNLQNLLNTELDALSEWCADNQRTIYLSKSQVLIIPLNLKANFENFSVNINNVSVSANEYGKYLGVSIDSKLNYNFHIKAVELKLSRAVGIIAELKSFLPQNVLLQLYYALVHSHLLYGLSVWGSTHPSYLAKLSTLQNKAIKIVGGGKIFDRVTQCSLQAVRVCARTRLSETALTLKLTAHRHMMKQCSRRAS